MLGMVKSNVRRDEGKSRWDEEGTHSSHTGHFKLFRQTDHLFCDDSWFIAAFVMSGTTVCELSFLIWSVHNKHVKILPLSCCSAKRLGQNTKIYFPDLFPHERLEVLLQLSIFILTWQANDCELFQFAGAVLLLLHSSAVKIARWWFSMLTKWNINWRALELYILNTLHFSISILKYFDSFVFAKAAPQWKKRQLQ